MRLFCALGLAGPEGSTVPNESHAIAGMFMAVFEYELQIGAVYFGACEATSFWKRGSFRSGSNIGSSRSSAGVSGMSSAKRASVRYRE